MRDIPALITFRIEKIIFMKVGGGGGGAYFVKNDIPLFPHFLVFPVWQVHQSLIVTNLIFT